MDKNTLHKFRFAAGLTTLTETEENEKHMKEEKELFRKACDAMTEVQKMCVKRLAEHDLSPEHKKQYKELHQCVSDCCDKMWDHYKSYEKE